MIKHWSVKEEELKKYPEQYAVWKLEQRINFGIGGGKIDRLELKKYWDKIIIDSYKRKALSLVV